VVDVIAGPNVDISAVDPLAPRYQEWQERAAKFKATITEKSDTLPFGGDQLGRDVLSKVIKGAQVSIIVGLASALFATLIGTILGAIGGYFGGRAGDFLEWVYNVFTAIPYILLVFALAAVLKSGPLAASLGNGVWTVVIILSLVGWTGIYRLVRAEYIKHRSREYVRAAEAIGASHASRMFTHILPNISHVVLVQLSLHVVGFIKAEVILSFLGLGVPIDMVSWGTMLAEAQTELVLGKWWQLVAATTFMASFVTAFALLTDALRDALDPKLR
jgi:peptide/nickel transport system permease protein